MVRATQFVVGALATVAISAAPAQAKSHHPFRCSGTSAKPGVLTGKQRHGVIVEGLCEVNSGAARVTGTVKLKPGATLLAAYGLNHKTGKPGSSLTVKGDVIVGRGATFVMGCGPPEFGCLDDPNPSNPMLVSHSTVTGNLVSRAPLGVIVHLSKIGGSIREKGGGGGLSCAPPTTGAFAMLMSPVFSDYEESSVHGGISVKDLTTCWLGIASMKIHGSVTLVNNETGDPDGVEVLVNRIHGNLACRGNSHPPGSPPIAQPVWDSAEITMNTLYPRKPQPNDVHGKRAGQCVLASPATPGGMSGPGKF